MKKENKKENVLDLFGCELSCFIIIIWKFLDSNRRLHTIMIIPDHISHVPKSKAEIDELEPKY